MGNVCQAGLQQNPARQAAIFGGVPTSVSAMTINKVCGSGLKAVMLAAQAIKAGDLEVAVAGGFDDRHHVAWFAGFLPLPEPRFAVVVSVNQPAEDFWASSVAAPVFAGAGAHTAQDPGQDIGGAIDSVGQVAAPLEQGADIGRDVG